MNRMTVTQLANDLEREKTDNKTLILVDVREPWEYELCHLPGSVLVHSPNIAKVLRRVRPIPYVRVYLSSWYSQRSSHGIRECERLPRCMELIGRCCGLGGRN